MNEQHDAGTGSGAVSRACWAGICQGFRASHGVWAEERGKDQAAAKGCGTMIAKLILSVCAFVGMGALFRYIAPGTYSDGFSISGHFLSYGLIVSLCVVGLVFKKK